MVNLRLEKDNNLENVRDETIFLVKTYKPFFHLFSLILCSCGLKIIKYYVMEVPTRCQNTFKRNEIS